jgi:hypothetical protein
MVVPGREPEIIPSVGREQWLPEGAEAFGRTIDEIYAFILEYFVPKIDKDYSVSISIQYNTEYHYPEWVESRIIPRSGETMDGRVFGFEVTSFELPGENGFPIKEDPKPPQPDNCQPFDIKVFEAERAAWEARGPARYRFTRTFDLLRFPPDLTIEAVPGRVPVMLSPVGDGPWQWGAGELDFAGRTIDDIYTVILERFDRSIDKSVSVWIRYNAEYHYPEFFEHRTTLSGHTGPVSGWLGFEISDFEILDDIH